MSGFEIRGWLDLIEERGGYQSLRSRRRRRSGARIVFDHITKKAIEATLDVMLYGDSRAAAPKGLLLGKSIVESLQEKS